MGEKRSDVGEEEREWENGGRKDKGKWNVTRRGEDREKREAWRGMVYCLQFICLFV